MERPKNTNRDTKFSRIGMHYRRFIQDFSRIASPLTKLTRKEVKYEWGPTQNNVFEELKARLTKALVLAQQEGNEYLVVYFDASGQGLGCVLMQRGKMSEISKAQDEALLERNLKLERIGYGVRTRLGRMWIPKIGELRAKILDEAHKSRYSIHLGTNKMYQDLKKEYWWPSMKNVVTEYVNKCLTCSLFKAEHQKPCGKMQPLPIPEWKWEEITMDFITKLSRTAKGNDTIWVIVDRLTKSAHFLPIRETSSLERLAEVFIKEVVSRHGMPLSIVSDRDTRFMSRFWKKFNEAMGTRLNISTAYHPQTDGQSEGTIQTLEDMLRACIIDFGGSWDSHLPLAEFSYNNNYHSTIGMPPFEMLYGRRYRTPVCWGEIGQKDFASLKVVKATYEKFDQIKARMKAAKDSQKSYVDKRRSDLEFQVGDVVLLKVSPWKGIIRFRKRGKLSPRLLGLSRS
ncbi:hypothetical protein L1987_15445 [Smallanthus sonchifolius]|uniref:Uncharacterized protein n=1 Tax=Smallanthus sonchifolius TaxID=185202 RepID=A0ACB9J6E9_9ASTR|nr:hypothetical protein L1987_15445 [Smallanthus sonchifolius]